MNRVLKLDENRRNFRCMIFKAILIRKEWVISTSSGVFHFPMAGGGGGVPEEAGAGDIPAFAAKRWT